MKPFIKPVEAVGQKLIGVVFGRTAALFVFETGHFCVEQQGGTQRFFEVNDWQFTEHYLVRSGIGSAEEIADWFKTKRAEFTEKQAQDLAQRMLNQFNELLRTDPGRAHEFSKRITKP